MDNNQYDQLTGIDMMINIKTAEEIGKEIINQLHKYNKEISMDDAEYIPLIKRIIESIEGYLKRSNKTEPMADNLSNNLFEHARGLYIELCEKYAEDGDISASQIQDESEAYFDYIYQHEEHPY